MIVKRTYSTLLLTLLSVILYSQLWLSSAHALEISIPETTITAGESAKIPIHIDQTDNLAGVRIILSYTPSELHFTGAVKTKETAQMMYVVNDKKPGELIIVMAGAQGIKGVDFSILDLAFSASKVTHPTTSRIEIRDAQLMSDKLKDLPHSIKVNSVTIIPQISHHKPRLPNN